jgi:hypothetical protein
MKKYIIILIILIYSCNPFAPSIDDNLGGQNFLADQSTIDGFFQNFSLAYNYRDTIIYQQLLDEDFVFSYQDYDKNTELKWDRETDIRKTHGLFTSSRYVDLVWNDYIFSEGDSVTWDATRLFLLQVTFSESDILNITGRAKIRLKRENSTSDWRMLQWVDESNF